MIKPSSVIWNCCTNKDFQIKFLYIKGPLFAEKNKPFVYETFKGEIEG